MKHILVITLLLTCTFNNRLSAQCSVNAGNDVTVYPGYAPLSCATLTASAAGQAPFTYAWSNGGSAQSVIACDAVTTIYIVTITDSAGCAASDTVVVSAVNVSCHPNGRKALVCHVPPGNPANAQNICVSVNAVPAHLAHGDYLGACVVVPPVPTTCSVSLGADTAICHGSTVTLDAGAGFSTYLWSDSSTAQTLPVDTPGTYWVSATDSAGCTASDTVVIAIDSNSLAVDAGADQTIGCSDSCATLAGIVTSGTAPYAFSWSTGDTADTITVCDSITTTYYLTVADSFGCAGSDSVTVAVSSATLAVDAGADQTLGCLDSCATLTASVSNGIAPFSYSWSNGDSATSVTVCDTITTIYYVTVTDSTGCTGSDSVTVTIAGTACGPGKVAVCHIPPGNPFRAHTICVSVSALRAHLAHGDDVGCCAPLVFTRFPRIPARAFPNPAFRKVSLEYNLEEADYITIDLYSIEGKRISNVFRGDAGEGFNLLDIDLHDFPEGMYVAEIKASSGEVSRQKFMLLK